jgi:hypothetical protein
MTTDPNTTGPEQKHPMPLSLNHLCIAKRLEIAGCSSGLVTLSVGFRVMFDSELQRVLRSRSFITLDLIPAAHPLKQ